MVTQTQPRGTLKKAKVQVWAVKGKDWIYTVDGQSWRIYNISDTSDGYWVASKWTGRYWQAAKTYGHFCWTRKQMMLRLDKRVGLITPSWDKWAVQHA